MLRFNLPSPARTVRTKVTAPPPTMMPIRNQLHSLIRSSVVHCPSGASAPSVPTLRGGMRPLYLMPLDPLLILAGGSFDVGLICVHPQPGSSMNHYVKVAKRPRELVQRMSMKDHGSATKDIEEWRHILESYSIRRLSRFLTSTSERANRLRQSNPFFAILSSDERNRLLNGFEGNK